MALALAAACSGSSVSGSMGISSCSLGCSSAASGGPFSCGVTDIAVNQAIRLGFTSPVDLFSVDSTTFQVVEEATGQTPPSSFTLDALDPRVLIYQPLLTFDSDGNPVFGLKQGATYIVQVPGTNLDSGPFITDSQGRPNGTRLRCTIVASQGVSDPRPGPPRVRATVSTVDPLTGQIRPDQNARGAFDVWRSSEIVLDFDDLMNPGTLVDPATGASSTLIVAFDPDGDVGDASDRVEIRGEWSLILNQAALTTRATFTPDADFPSRGQDPSPRKVVLSIPSSVVDLGGNPLTNPGNIVFVPEEIVFPFTSLTETFDDRMEEDALRGGSPWASDGGLGKGPGGGSGRLGDLTIPPGRSVVLRTDSEDFSGIGDGTVFEPANVLGGSVDPVTGGLVEPVVGGLFEFSRLRLRPGSSLIFEGPNPVRIHVRGEARVEGLIDVAGRSSPDHEATDALGGSGGRAGPGGGAGGDGGHRSDGTSFEDLGGIPNPGVVLYADVDGKPGGGVPFPSSFAPTASVAAGEGGVAWPQPTADRPDIGFPSDPDDHGVLELSERATPRCKVVVPSTSGGGGGHALSGVSSTTAYFPLGHAPLPFALPPEALGGESGDLAIDDLVRSLDPDLGLLRGGGGGGGGGTHLEGTRSDAFLAGCTRTLSGDPPEIIVYEDSSGGGGGGGGGGLQIQSGRRIVLESVLDASGGNGGGRPTLTSKTQGGGGGAGGAVLLQAPSIQIDDLPGRIDVGAGRGGLGFRASTAGDGGPGFVRLESHPPVPVPAVLEPFVRPDRATIEALGAELGDVFTAVEWIQKNEGPTASSGAQSCWQRPSGNFFVLRFQEDIPGDPGWDALLRLVNVAAPQSFRGENDILPNTLESVLGNELGESPFVVRFQGARLVDPGADLCNVALAGQGIEIKPGSLSPWVSHPAELNDVPLGDSVNIVRYMVIWDASGTGYGQIVGVEELFMNVQPE